MKTQTFRPSLLFYVPISFASAGALFLLLDLDPGENIPRLFGKYYLIAFLLFYAVKGLSQKIEARDSNLVYSDLFSRDEINFTEIKGYYTEQASFMLIDHNWRIRLQMIRGLHSKPMQDLIRLNHPEITDVPLTLYIRNFPKHLIPWMVVPYLAMFIQNFSE